MYVHCIMIIIPGTQFIKSDRIYSILIRPVQIFLGVNAYRLILDLKNLIEIYQLNQIKSK